MSTLKVDNLLNSAGNESPISVPGAAKAWVNYNGVTNTIKDSFNVSSVTDVNSGVYTVNFTNAFSNANYATATSHQRIATADEFINVGFNNSTTACNIELFAGGSTQDTYAICVTCFGD